MTVEDDVDAHFVAMLGSGKGFHLGQREAILDIVGAGGRALVVQRTGWGKSLVYWIATRILRDRGAGPTLVISPLLALMRNQIAAAKALDLRAATINSSNVEDWTTVEEGLAAGDVDVLIISPERISNERFAKNVLPALGAIGLFVIDEAHCISDWGHDFRPEYRRLGRILATLPATVPVLATTATANTRVVNDVSAQLGGSVSIRRGPLARESLSLHVIELADQAERLAWLAEHVPTLDGSGIIYCLTVADTLRVSAWLSEHGVSALPYYGGLDGDARLVAEEALLANRIKVLVATSALGMGFDKGDLAFVIHFQRPGSPVAYYQQVGRAGRAIDHAEAVLLVGREDDQIADFFIESAFPPIAHQETVLAELAKGSGASVPELLTTLNLRPSQIQKVLTLAEIEGAVGHERRRWFRTAKPWSADRTRIDGVTAIRRAELAEMQAYVKHRGCRMQFLAHALDDPMDSPCGRCDRDAGAHFPTTVDAALLAEAITFLRRDARPIEPRKLWPAGAISGLSGAIRPHNEPGMALSIYRDAGWGSLVHAGKYRDAHFDGRLVTASAELIRERWRPDPGPEWVTAVPSQSHPDLVPTFAAALAAELSLPFHILLSSAGGPEQKTMENSAQQVRNVADKIALTGSVPPGVGLLVDDIVDSRWTLTYAGHLLISSGANAIIPFALAMASAGSDA